MNRPGRFAAMSACALAIAAGAAGAATAATDTQPVDIQFRAVNGTTPVTCGELITGLGTTKATANLRDFRLYIANVKLIRKDGKKVALKLGGNKEFNYASGGNAVTLIDLENGQGQCNTGSYAMNRVIKGTVPKGNYRGITMYMGVPVPMNHTDITTAPAPLNVAAMNWSWQSGRKFSKIEVGDPNGTAGSWKSKVFYVHMGSTGCVGNPATGATTSCKASNRGSIPFTSGFNAAKQAIAVDIGALLAGNDVTVNQAGAGGCMAGPTDPECGPIFDAFQIDWQANGSGTGLPIDGGKAQRVFKVVSR